MRLWLSVAAAILTFVAFRFVANWAHHEGLAAAYQMRLAECTQQYPKYRCEIELDAYNPDARR